MHYRIEIDMATYDEVTLAIGDLSIAIDGATSALLADVATETDEITMKITELGSATGNSEALQAILDSVEKIKDKVEVSTGNISTAVKAMVPPDETPLEAVSVVPTPDDEGLPDSPAIVATTTVGSPEGTGTGVAQTI